MKPKKIILALIISCCIELFVINFSNVVNVLDTTTEKNKVFTLDDMSLVNWNEENGYIISENDPNFIIKNVNTDIKKIKISANVNRVIPYIDIFYTNQEEEEYNGDLLIKYSNEIEKNVEIDINQYVKDLRIDLGDEEGMILEDIEVVINPIKVNISISRIIAMFLIYLSFVGLFYLQKNPDYNINEIKGEK